MDEDRMWLLIARKFSKEATLQELQELTELLKSYPDIQYASLLMDELKESTGTGYGVDEISLEEMQRNGLEHMPIKEKVAYPWQDSTRRRRGITAGIPAMAAFLVLIAFGVFAWNRHHDKKATVAGAQKQESAVYVASKPSSIVLQDGTKVWINQGSTLRCSNAFDVKNREVYLEGEAFFEVAADAKKPFIVHADKRMDIKVLGTRFNVKAYPDDPYLETSLISGKVAVNFKSDMKKQIILRPHEKITFYTNHALANNKIVSKRIMQTPRYQLSDMKPNPINKDISELSWMKGYLAFDDMPFMELACDLERIYHVKIVFKDERLKQYHLTGVFKDENLDEVLQALRVTTPFQYTISNKKVFIYH